MTALVWAIKASLLQYVRDMPDGAIDTSGGATARGEAFAFPAAGEDADGTLRFAGAVTLTGHSGMMRVVVADPRLVPAGDGWRLTIADDADPTGRMPFADVPRTVERDGTRQGESTTLTAEGADLFFGPYREGTPLDDPRVED